jgi:hypothetical protein
VRRGRPGQRGATQRPGGGGAGNRPGAPRTRGASAGSGRPRQAPAKQAPDEKVELPRTDETGVSKAGREQPVIEPVVETTPAPVADAPDTTTTKKQVEDPTKLEDSGKKKAAPRKKKADN